MAKKNMTEGPLGFPTTDELAKSLEALIKTLPKECTYRKAGAVPASVELVEGERADVSLITAETLDREGEVVLAGGIDVGYFLKNPVVTFAHKYDELPVGRAAWTKTVPGGMKAKTIYSDATEVSRACWQMTKEGILKGKSVGFLPTKIRSPTKDEVSKNPTWKDASAVIESSVLLEYAVAPIPMNPDALVEAVAKGYASEAMLKRLGLPVSRKLTAPQVKAVVRHIKVTKPKLSQSTLTLKAMESIDVERIAEEVIARLANRGRV